MSSITRWLWSEPSSKYPWWAPTMSSFGVPAREPIGGFAGHRRLGAEQVDPLARQLAQSGQAPDPVRTGHPVRDIKVQRARRQSHAITVAVDEIGPPQRVAQARGRCGSD